MSSRLQASRMAWLLARLTATSSSRRSLVSERPPDSTDVVDMAQISVVLAAVYRRGAAVSRSSKHAGPVQATLEDIACEAGLCYSCSERMQGCDELAGSSRLPNLETLSLLTETIRWQARYAGIFNQYTFFMWLGGFDNSLQL